MMGSGKTTVGRGVAAIVGARFLDTDEMVEESVGMTVAELFAASGEKAFRALESAAVRRVPQGDVVVAAGGGAVLDAGNREVMRSSGVVVWLNCGAEALAERIGDPAARPLLAGSEPSLETIAALLAEREPLYAAAATARVETEGRAIDEVIAEVAGLWST